MKTTHGYSDADIASMQRQYVKAKRAYFNTGTVIMTDATYDKLEATLQKLTPDFEPLHTAGFSVGKKVEKQLPVPMPSLAKILHDQEGALERWVGKYAKGWVHVAAKVDGTSVLIEYKDGQPHRMMTRGDGTLGKDNSYLLPYLKQLPVVRPGASITLRCEIVLPYSVWKRKWSGQFKDPRGQVNGVMNKQDAHSSLADFQVIVLENLSSNSCTLEGLHEAEKKVVGLKDHLPLKRILKESVTTSDTLIRVLTDMRKRSDYELDGLVLSTSATAARSADNPKHKISWKYNPPEEAVDAEVIGITWTVSRSGRLTPTAQLNPVRCGGVTVKNVTLNNAKWAKDRGIGPGAIVQMIRSGGVIPKIIGVKRKAKMTPPPKSVIRDAKLTWDENGTNLVIRSDALHHHDGVALDRMARFLKGMEIEFAGTGVAQKLLNACIVTPPQVVRATVDELRQLQGFGDASAQRLYDSIQRVRRQQHFVGKVAAASGVFAAGVGSRRFEQIIDHLGAFGARGVPTIEKLMTTPGLPEIVAHNIHDQWDHFTMFLRNTGLSVTYKTPTQAAGAKGSNGPLTGMLISFTGYRDKEQEAEITRRGGIVVPFGSRTTHLLVTDGGKASGKVAKAEAKGITVTTFDRLTSKSPSY